MSDPIIPTPQDKQLLMQDTVSKTGNYNTPGLDLGPGFAPGGVGQPVSAVVQVSAVDFGSGNESYSFILQDSPDNINFTSISPSMSPLAIGALAVSGLLRQRYARLMMTMGGTTPSITYKAWLNPLP